MGEVEEAYTLAFPERIFRYRPLDKGYSWEEIERALSEREIFLSSAKSVNDPFEFTVVYEKSPLDQLMRDIRLTERFQGPLSRSRMNEISGARIPRHEYRKFKARFKNPNSRAGLEHLATKKSLDNIREKARLACFCEQPDIIPMWAHYSGHAGVCLVFKIDMNRLRELGPLIALPVKYMPERPTVTTLDIRTFTMRSRQSYGAEKVKDRVFDALFLSKAQDWSYEREWRIVDTSGTRPGYEKIDFLELESILFGISSTEQDLRRAIKDFGARVPIYKGFLSQKDFGIEFFRVSMQSSKS